MIKYKKTIKEVLSWWKKKEKENIDAKKYKDRQDFEKQRKIKDEEDKIYQKKRLEFLMRQSDIYAT